MDKKKQFFLIAIIFTIVNIFTATNCAYAAVKEAIAQSEEKPISVPAIYTEPIVIVIAPSEGMKDGDDLDVTILSEESLTDKKKQKDIGKEVISVPVISYSKTATKPGVEVKTSTKTEPTVIIIQADDIKDGEIFDLIIISEESPTNKEEQKDVGKEIPAAVVSDSKTITKMEFEVKTTGDSKKADEVTVMPAGLSAVPDNKAVVVPQPEVKISDAGNKVDRRVIASKGYEIQALPGSSWGQITYDNDGLTGSGFMGIMNQGVEWFTLPGDIKFTTFAEYRYRTRAYNKTYYDTRGPALGIDFKKSIFSFGLAYYWEYFPGLLTTSRNRELYLTWFYDWDLKPRNKDLFLGIKGLPGSNWVSVTYDINGLNGSGAQGFINQGIDWFKLPGDVMVNTFVEYRFKTRTQNTKYYNTSGTALGIDFKKSVFHFGVNYYWEKLPELKQTSNRGQFYLTWFHNWDLKKYFKH